MMIYVLCTNEGWEQTIERAKRRELCVRKDVTDVNIVLCGSVDDEPETVANNKNHRRRVATGEGRRMRDAHKHIHARACTKRG